MLDVLKNEVLEGLNRLEIMRIILEAIYAKATNAGC